MEKEYVDYIIRKTIPVEPAGDVDSQCKMDGRSYWSDLPGSTEYLQSYVIRAEFLIPEGLIDNEQ